MPAIPSGYVRVERDDRLFDILPPSERKEKGVELWEKWTSDTVELIRRKNHQQSRHTLSRAEVEQALKTYQKISFP